jgi:hypothetical protein
MKHFAYRFLPGVIWVTIAVCVVALVWAVTNNTRERDKIRRVRVAHTSDWKCSKEAVQMVCVKDIKDSGVVPTPESMIAPCGKPWVAAVPINTDGYTDSIVVYCNR